MTDDIVNPLVLLDDTQLWNAQLMVELICHRSKAPLAKARRRQYVCTLGQVLTLEFERRGIPAPVAPFHAGQAKPEAL